MLTRHLPDVPPAVAPFDNVGTERTLHGGNHVPNIVKDGTPHEAPSSLDDQSLPC
jgi:hypothetical protein